MTIQKNNLMEYKYIFLFKSFSLDRERDGDLYKHRFCQINKEQFVMDDVENNYKEENCIYIESDNEIIKELCGKKSDKGYKLWRKFNPIKENHKLIFYTYYDVISESVYSSKVIKSSHNVNDFFEEVIEKIYKNESDDFNGRVVLVIHFGGETPSFSRGVLKGGDETYVNYVKYLNEKNKHDNLMILDYSVTGDSLIGIDCVSDFKTAYLNSKKEIINFLMEDNNWEVFPFFKVVETKKVEEVKEVARTEEVELRKKFEGLNHKLKIEVDENNVKICNEVLSYLTNNKVKQKIYFVFVNSLKKFYEELKSDKNKVFDMSNPKESFYPICVISRQSGILLDPVKPYNFFDSSIWNYTLIMDEWNKDTFSPVINKIIDNYDKDFYNCISTMEFIELNKRRLENAHLASIKPGEGHNNVVPFKFHSEKETGKRIQAILDGTKKEEKGEQIVPATLGIKKEMINLFWRILIVDDHAKEGLNLYSSNEKKSKGTKLGRIKQIITTYFEADSIYFVEEEENLKKGKINFQFEIAEDIKSAVELLEDNKIFDLILVDYNLKRNENRSDSIQIKEYETNSIKDKESERIKKKELGSELIEFIINKISNERERADDKSGFKTGPGKNFWFMPISVFSQSMIFDLINKGVSFVHDDYYLSFGADPINTPALFCYYFLGILRAQIETYNKITPVSLLEEGRKMMNKKESKLQKKLAEEVFLKCLRLDIIKGELKDLNTSFTKSYLTKNLENVREKDAIVHLREYSYQLVYRISNNNEELAIEKALASHYINAT